VFIVDNRLSAVLAALSTAIGFVVFSSRVDRPPSSPRDDKCEIANSTQAHVPTVPKLSAAGIGHSGPTSCVPESRERFDQRACPRDHDHTCAG
jgi:hypothetical protein